MPIKAAALDKKLKELIAEGNARLNDGDIQGAKAIKREINKVQSELDQLTAAGVTTARAEPREEQPSSATSAFTREELQNYRHILGRWEQEKNRALEQPGANQRKTMENYRRRLVAFGDALLKNNNLEGASIVKDEVTTITLELDELLESASKKNSAPQYIAPGDKQAPETEVSAITPPKSTREPITHANSVQGLAGAPSFSENNIYSFDLNETGPSSTLTYYVTGRRSTDSAGKIWLINPEGQRIKVANWSGSVLVQPATGIKTYKNLKPITADISAWVKAPGTYRVEFEWTGGIDPLVIYRVEITS